MRKTTPPFGHPSQEGNFMSKTTPPSGHPSPEGNFIVCGDVEIGLEDVIIQRTEREGMVVANEGALTVALETGLTEELVAEGLAREFVSKVQAMRKEADFEVTQRIFISVNAGAEVAGALEKFRDYIMAETLCVELDTAGRETCGMVELDMNGRMAGVRVESRDLP